MGARLSYLLFSSVEGDVIPNADDLPSVEELLEGPEDLEDYCSEDVIIPNIESVDFSIFEEVEDDEDDLDVLSEDLSLVNKYRDEQMNKARLFWGEEKQLDREGVKADKNDVRADSDVIGVDFLSSPLYQARVRRTYTSTTVVKVVFLGSSEYHREHFELWGSLTCPCINTTGRQRACDAEKMAKIRDWSDVAKMEWTEEIRLQSFTEPYVGSTEDHRDNINLLGFPVCPCFNTAGRQRGCDVNGMSTTDEMYYSLKKL